VWKRQRAVFKHTVIRQLGTTIAYLYSRKGLCCIQSCKMWDPPLPPTPDTKSTKTNRKLVGLLYNHNSYYWTYNIVLMCWKAKAQLNYTTYSYLQNVDGWGGPNLPTSKHSHELWRKVELLCSSYFTETSKKGRTEKKKRLWMFSYSLRSNPDFKHAFALRGGWCLTPYDGAMLRRNQQTLEFNSLNPLMHVLLLNNI
jgi:hypothetical protein